MKNAIKRVITILLVCLLLIGSFPVETLAQASDEAIPISTKEELNNVRNNLSGKYYLTTNIVFTENDFAKGGVFYNNGEGWEPIGSKSAPFTGSFNGNGHSIVNLFSKSTTIQYMGLFGYNKGSISNIVFSNVELDVRSNFHNLFCGVVAGYNAGTIQNVRAEGNVTAYCTAVDPSRYYNRLSIGGIVGYNEQTVVECVTECNINGNYLNGNYKDGLRVFVGGIVGCNEKSVLNCYNYSTKIYAAKSSIVRQYGSWGSSVQTQYYSFTGGIVGLNRTTSGEVTSCRNYVPIDTDGNILGCIVGVCNSGASISDCENSADIVNTYDISGIVNQIDADDAYHPVSLVQNVTTALHEVINCRNTGCLTSTEGIAAGIVGSVRCNGYTTNTKVDMCANEGEIYAKDEAAGIGTGTGAGDVYRSYNIAPVTSTTRDASGINIRSGMIEKCYNTGEVVALNSNGYGAAIGINASIINCYNTVPGLSLCFRANCSFCYTINSASNGYIFSSSSKLSKNIAEMRVKDIYMEAGFDFENTWNIDPDINNGFPYLTFAENDITSSNFSYSYIGFSETNNELEYPIFNEATFAKQLEAWMKCNENFEVFSAYLDQGYTYKDILYMTIDTPVMADDGSAYSVEGATQIKDVMAYLVFSDVAQKYLSDTIVEVKNKISEGKTSDAYTYFLKQLKNFNTQYFYFQEELNHRDTFNQTLYSLLLAKTAMTIVDGLKVTYKSGETKYLIFGTDEYNDTVANMYSEDIISSVSLKSYSYFTDMYKANVSESPQYYDDLYYYILSGGDTSFLNSYYEDVLNGYSTVIKDSKKLVKIIKEGSVGDIGDVTSWIDLGFTNISYFAEKYDNSGDWSSRISDYKEAWEWADSAINIMESVSSGSLFGLMGASYSLADKYIGEVKEVYEKAESTEAGWYALAYYYLGKENPDVLRAIVDPDTGAVTFSGNTISSMALYGVPFDNSDPIQKNLQLYFEKNLWAKQNSYSPSEKFKFYLWNASNVANSITDIDCIEYRDAMIDYILAEINLENGQTGVLFDVTATPNDSSLGEVSGGGTYMADSRVTLCAIPYKGATFIGWKDRKSGAFISSNQNYVMTLTSDITVEAVFIAGKNKANLPVIPEEPQNARYYKGQKSAALFVEPYVDDGGEISVDWYRVSTNTYTNDIYVGSGTSFYPSTDKTGEFYYYAVVNNTVRQSDSTNVAVSVKTKVVRIIVMDPIVTDLVISRLPNKKVYVPGESFSNAGMVVELQYSDGTSVRVTDYELSYDFSTVGPKIVTVSYLGFVKYINVEVTSVLNGQFSNGIVWRLDTVSGDLTISGEGIIPNDAYRSFLAYREYIKRLIIGEGITEIGANSLRYLSYLEQVQFPDTLHIIGSHAFYGCTHLSSIEIRETVTEIGALAFDNRYLLEISGIDESTASDYALENGIAFNCLHKHTYGDWQITVEATPVSSGSKYRICTECGRTVTEEIPILDELSFKGASLTLHDNIAINYKVDKALFVDCGYRNPYIKFSLNNVEKIVTEYKVVDDNYVFDFTDIAPNQMNDTIYATLYAEYDGVEYASETKEYSVAQYCYNMLNKYSGDEYSKLRTLLVDLLNYGAQSQIYTDHNTNALVTEQLTEEQASWGTTETPELHSVMDQNFKVIDNPKVVWKGAGLNLQDSVTMRFKIATESIGGLSIKVTSESGEWIISSDDFEETDGGYYVFFDGLNAGQMSTAVYLTVYEGDTAVSNTICYSIESYAYSKQNSADEKLNNLLVAMMQYGNSAYSYVTK